MCVWGAVRSDARGGSQALESCRPAALAAARRGASVDFTHTHELPYYVVQISDILYAVEWLPYLTRT